MYETVVGYSPRFNAGRMPLVEHRLQNRRINFERDVKIEIPLRLEFEGCPGVLEKCQVGTVLHLIERVQHRGAAARFGFAYFQRPGQAEAEKVLVESAGFLRVAATISVVV